MIEWLLFLVIIAFVGTGYYLDSKGPFGVSVPSNEWRDAVASIVKKCRLASKLEMNTVFNPEGSESLAQLLEQMAEELDRR